MTNPPRSFAASCLDGVREVVRAGADLAIPLRCGGCGRSGTGWCADCEAALHDDPFEVSPRVPPPVGTWATGRYRGPHRQAVLALKERDRRDLVAPLGAALARGLTTLASWSEVPTTADTLIIVPAPTRVWAARRRGGDPVTAVARAAAHALGPRVLVAPVLRTSAWARDSAGLSARHRVDNLEDAISVHGDVDRLAPLRAPATAVVLVDDVLTTGATATESVRVLGAAGIGVHAVLVVAAV